MNFLNEKLRVSKCISKKNEGIAAMPSFFLLGIKLLDFVDSGCHIL